MNKLLTYAWYQRAWWLVLLLPLSGLYWLLAAIHRRLQPTPYLPRVPLIVVGNLSVGGTGKTPLCLALARHFQQQNKRVVILSRGYRGNAQHFPQVVESNADPLVVGDEALLLAQLSGCTVVIDPQRARAARYAVESLHADILISDDGLQHYALGRHVEIVVIDGQRGFGNGWLLPAGPLRESTARLKHVDFIVSNGPCQHSLPVPARQLITMRLPPAVVVNLLTGERFTPSDWQQRYAQSPIHAVAGIGNPERFFQSLSSLGFVIIPHAFADHHAFQQIDLGFADNVPVVMTAKDAVKCRKFAQANWWSLVVEAELPTVFFESLQQKLNAVNLHETKSTEPH